MFLHVGDPADVAGRRRMRQLVNCQGQSRLTGDAGPALWGCGEAQMPRALACLWDALVQGWSGLVTLSCLAEVHGLFTTGRVE